MESTFQFIFWIGSTRCLLQTTEAEFVCSLKNIKILTVAYNATATETENLLNTNVLLRVQRLFPTCHYRR
jgi:hypothetical protein